MALIICPECGQKVSDLADACPKCGYPLHEEETALTCPECGQNVAENDAECQNCGYPLKEEPSVIAIDSSIIAESEQNTHIDFNQLVTQALRLCEQMQTAYYEKTAALSEERDIIEKRTLVLEDTIKQREAHMREMEKIHEGYRSENGILQNKVLEQESALSDAKVTAETVQNENQILYQKISELEQRLFELGQTHQNDTFSVICPECGFSLKYKEQENIEMQSMTVLLAQDDELKTESNLGSNEKMEEPSQEDAELRTTCPECGQAITREMDFCGNCGYNLKG